MTPRVQFLSFSNDACASHPQPSQTHLSQTQKDRYIYPYIQKSAHVWAVVALFRRAESLSLSFDEQRVCHWGVVSLLCHSLSVSVHRRCRVASLKPRGLAAVSAFAGEDGDMAGGGGLVGTPITTTTRFVANRRRTDLMPTIPSPRDINLRDLPSSGRSSSAGGKSFTRSPGRTYSMSRLDQLAQPRRPRIATPEQLLQQQLQQQQSLAASSMSRSMSHLARAGAVGGQQLLQHPAGLPLKRTDNSRSMGTLPGAGGSGGLTRPTRAERLRRKAREHQQPHQQKEQGKRPTLGARGYAYVRARPDSRARLRCASVIAGR